MMCGGCKQVAHGAVGLTKAALRIDRASDETIAARREACMACEYLEKREVLGVVQVRRCLRCGCLVKPKAVISGESCPVGKWAGF